MYLFSDRLYRKDEITLDDKQKQVIFTAIDNETILSSRIMQYYPTN